MPRATVLVTVLSIALATAVMSGCAPSSRTEIDASSTATPAPMQTTASPQSGADPQTPTPSAPPEGPTPIASPAGRSVAIVTSGVDPEGVYASGIVPEVVETVGRCILTAASGTDIRTVEMDAAASTSAMNCGVMHIPVPSGAWELTLAYSSDATSALSEPVTVTVP